MMNYKINLYYEVPGVGGGNEEFSSLADAKYQMDCMVTSYPDMYAEITVWDSTGHYQIREYDGKQVNAS